MNRILLPIALVVLAGCINWDQPGEATTTVLITQDFGKTLIKKQEVTVQNGSTAMDALMAAARVETKYGGGFVNAIDGLRSQYPPTKVDWFYEVNGWYADVGASETPVRVGDQTHWDYRDWSRGEAIGLFNTFPWEQATYYVTPNATVPDWIGTTHPWTGEAPEPWVLIATPTNVPTELVPAVHLEGNHVSCNDELASGTWALVTRAYPSSSVRAIIIQQGAQATRPAYGQTWVTPESGQAEECYG